MIDNQEARKILEEAWGISGEAERISGERDLNFRIIGKGKKLLKYYQDTTEIDYLALQDRTLAHLKSLKLVPELIKTKDDLLRVRTDLKETNMIEIFNNSNIKQSIIKEMKEELAHNKIDIIMANINHFIKQFEQININVLYEIVLNNIKLFKVDKETFNKAIDKLIKNDYIQSKDDYIKKILYTL